DMSAADPEPRATLDQADLRVVCRDLLNQPIGSVRRSVIDDDNIGIKVEIENLAEHGLDIASLIQCRKAKKDCRFTHDAWSSSALTRFDTSSSKPTLGSHPVKRFSFSGFPCSGTERGFRNMMSSLTFTYFRKSSPAVAKAISQNSRRLRR